MSFVLQDWLGDLSFMQQSVLLTAIRGADTLPKRHISKYLLRWYRRCILTCAFEKVVHKTPDEPCTGNFTGSVPMGLEDLWRTYLQDIDMILHHFHLHVLHASEILGYKHPDRPIREWWAMFYHQAVKDMHVRPETEEEMDKRLGDSRDQWMEAGGQHEVWHESGK